MNCPNCKRDTLADARTSENSPLVDGVKCTYCDSLYRYNESRHLVPIIVGKSQKITDADIQPGISKEGFETVLKTVTHPIANKAKKESTLYKRSIYRKSQGMFDMLVSGMSVPEVQKITGKSRASIYGFKHEHKKEIEEAILKASGKNFTSVRAPDTTELKGVSRIDKSSGLYSSYEVETRSRLDKVRAELVDIERQMTGLSNRKSHLKDQEHAYETILEGHRP